MNNTLSDNRTVIFNGYSCMNSLGSGNNKHNSFNANTLKIHRSIICVSNSGVQCNKNAFASRHTAQSSTSTHGGLWTGSAEIPAGIPESIMCAQKKRQKEIFYQNIKKACLDDVTNNSMSQRSAMKKYGVTRTTLSKWLKECPAWTGNYDDVDLSAELLHKRILEVNADLLAGRRVINDPVMKTAETPHCDQGKRCANHSREDALPRPVLPHQAANGAMAQAARFWRPW